MAITVITEENKDRRVTGLTAGNEYIWQVPENAEVNLHAINQAAGTSTIKFSSQDAEPTDFTDFVPSEIGSHTETFAEISRKGIKWIGLDIDSGTWDLNLTPVRG